MDQELRILILEDQAFDAELTEFELRRAQISFTPRRVDTEADFLRELEEFQPQLILADYKLPAFDGLTALAQAQAQCPEVPFIFVSGAIGEEVAIDSLQRGATDYVLKHRLSRLGPAVVRALREAEDRRERRRAEETLRRREAVLVALSLAAERFLRGTPWEEEIAEILARLGQAMEVCRVLLFENHQDQQGNLLTSLRYAWSPPEYRIRQEDLQDLPWKEGFEGWAQSLSRGQVIQGHTREFSPPEGEALREHQVQSVVTVPIFVGPDWWGFLSFDECVAERQWSTVELEALKAAASTLGAALQHARSQERLQDSEQRLRFLTSQLLRAQEKERKRISMELHDELGQSLLVLKLRVRDLERDLREDQRRLKEECEGTVKYLDGVIDNIRRLSRDLSPSILEDLGLTAALRYQCDEFGKSCEIRHSLELQGLDGLFPPEAQIIIYRIVQESLTNVFKHAQATRVAVAIEGHDEYASLVVEDDGRGFQVEEVLARTGADRGLGLAALHERARMLGGSLRILSQKGVGTRITCKIPFPE